MINKEAIEKLEAAIAEYDGPMIKFYYAGRNVKYYVAEQKLFDRALALLKAEQPEPKCKTCGDSRRVPTPQSIGFGKDNAIMQECPDCKVAEQPPASELMKEAVELDKMCVSEIVAKYESSHNAITILKRKFRAACESDEWMKSATQFYENGGCPICFSTDEAGCKEGCYLGQLQVRLDVSETNRKELLVACEEAQKVFGFIAENYKSCPHFPNAERLVDSAIINANK